MTTTWQLHVYSMERHVACIILYISTCIHHLLFTTSIYISIRWHLLLISSIHPSSSHYIYPPIFYTLHLSIHLLFISSIHPSCIQYIYPSIFYPLHLSIHLLFISSLHPSFIHFIYPSIFYSFHLSMHPLYLSIHPSYHPYIYINIIHINIYLSILYGQ